MIVCDMVWSDPYTHKKTILGAFSNLVATAFPVIHPVMAVYLVLTECLGKMPIRIRLVNVDDEGDPLCEITSELDSPDPRAVIDAVFVVAGVVFPAAGEYRLQAYAGDEFLIERRILIINPETGAQP